MGKKVFTLPSHKRARKADCRCNTMAATVLQLQWGMESTTFTTYDAVTKLMRAASSDNVQPQAIIACVGLGATLAICPITIAKVQSTVCPKLEPVIISLLNVTIGYAKGDTISEMNKSEAGLRFLALASALATTNPRQGAHTIHGLIMKSALDKALAPTLQQVSKLLHAIHGRCLLAGFAEEMGGWRLLLEKSLQDKLHHPMQTSPYNYQLNGEALDRVIEGFRELCRVGDATTDKMVIRTAMAVPWLAAFTKWCLGVPPSITFADGTVLLENVNSRVHLVVQVQRTMGDVEVKLYSSHDCLSTLFVSGGKNVDEYFGMVKLPTYGKLLLRQHKLDDDIASQAIVQALSYALRQVRNNLVVVGAEPDISDRVVLIRDIALADESYAQLRLCAFADERTILEAAARVFGHSQMNALQTLGHGETVFELPLVRLLYEDRKKTCFCSNCSKNGMSKHGCFKFEFIFCLSMLVADILAFSLFESPENLLISTRNIGRESNEFKTAITHTLMGRRVGCCAASIIATALRLVGHEVEKRGTWILSCEKGQAVWPAVYESMTLPKSGYLRLLWLHGDLIFQEDVYSHIKGPRKSTDISDKRQDGCLSQPSDILSGIGLKWNIASDEDHLEAVLAVTDPSGTFSPATVNPAFIISSLANALHVEACNHSRNATLENPESICDLEGPFRVIECRKGDSTGRRRFPIPDPEIASDADSNSGASRNPEGDSDDAEEDIDENYDGDDGYSDSNGPEEPSFIEETNQGGSTDTGVELSEDLGLEKCRILVTGHNNAVRFVALGKNEECLRLVIRGGSCLSCAITVCQAAGNAAVIF